MKNLLILTIVIACASLIGGCAAPAPEEVAAPEVAAVPEVAELVMVEVSAEGKEYDPAVAIEQIPAGSYLFVQEAESGELVLEEDGMYTLSLSGVDTQTLVFSDRPVRAAFHMSTAAFVDTFEGFFSDEPPNAALAYEIGEAEGTPETLVLTVSEPAYDVATGTLTYRAVEVAGSNARGISHEGGAPVEVDVAFGAASLFLDDVSFPVTSTGWELQVYGDERLVRNYPGIRITVTYEGQTQSLADAVGARIATYTGSGALPTGDLLFQVTGVEGGGTFKIPGHNIAWTQSGNGWSGSYYFGF